MSLILVNIGSGNDLTPAWCQAIPWTNADLLLNDPLGTNFNEVWIEIQNFLFKKIHLKYRLQNGGHFAPSSVI